MNDRSYLTFTEERMAGRKTAIYHVSNVTNGVYLGSIRWSGSFRKFGFMPAENTIFDPRCMRELATECEDRTKEHRDQTEEP